MIDTKELRRLAQAATPGPWYVTGKLTRYVEARIDGGLIQEVAACGPTKADGGYGPQQEANARLIAAANPATISELLDRLEAAEKEHEACEQRDRRQLTPDLGGSLEAYRVVPLYRAPGAQSTSSVPDGYLTGVKAVATMVQKKADDYANEHGYDDIGGLSFGPGMNGEIKMDYYTNLLELVDEVNAMLAAPEAKP